jgi:hypothetical protein
MKTTRLLTKPAENAHLVKAAFERAEEKYGKAWGFFSAEVREALVKSEAFNIIAQQHDEANKMTQFAVAVVRELGAREEA